MPGAVTPKLRAFVGLGAAALLAGLALGRVELIILSIPLLAAIAVGAADPSPSALEVALVVGAERIMEKDEVSVVLQLLAGARPVEAEIALAIPTSFELLEGEPRLRLWLQPHELRDHEIRLMAKRWGAHRLGVVPVRIIKANGLTETETVHDLRRVVRVYPSLDRMTRSLEPAETHTYGGDYVARIAGEGIEFAQVRPFSRGDSARRVNWRVTSRRSELHVNLSHPERDADVLLFLDSFTDIDLGGTSTLDLAVRGASVIARHHLRHNDRVGLVGFGGILRWLTASMGRTHTYRIADFLLDVNATFSYAWKDIRLLPYGTLPAGALVIAFSPLVDERAVSAISDIGARGFSIAVIDTLAEDRISPAEGAEGALAYHVWKLRREMTRDRLRARGVPVTGWAGQGGVEAALASLPRRRAGLGRVTR